MSNSYFRYLAANRRLNVAASMTHGVFAVKKNGERYAKPSATERSEEAAIKKAAYIQSLNPGSKYIVEAL